MSGDDVRCGGSGGRVVCRTESEVVYEGANLWMKRGEIALKWFGRSGQGQNGNTSNYVPHLSPVSLISPELDTEYTLRARVKRTVCRNDCDARICGAVAQASLLVFSSVFRLVHHHEPPGSVCALRACSPRKHREEYLHRTSAHRPPFCCSDAGTSKAERAVICQLHPSHRTFGGLPHKGQPSGS